MAKGKRSSPARVNEAVGAYLKALRKEYGYTQEEIANGIKVTCQFICNIESGRASAPESLIRYVVKEYHLSPIEVVAKLTEIYRTEISRSLGLKLSK